jgi:hypothetical protein
MAIEEGRIESPDSLIFPYWPQLRPSDQSMTFRHLANMMSGYACNDVDAQGNPLPPGSRWAYNDYGISLYMRTLDKVFQTSDKLETVSQQRISQPLQFEDFGSLLRQGRVDASVRDYARVGWFWLNRGNWNGIQLLPSQYFDDYVKTDVPSDVIQSTAIVPDDYLGVGSDGGSTISQHGGQGIYGFTWWFNRCLTVPPQDPPLLAWPSAPPDAYLASGKWGRQVLLVIPSLGLVVAAANNYEATWGDTILTDPPDLEATLNQNLKLLTEAAFPRLMSLSVSGKTLSLDAGIGLPGSEFVIEFCPNPDQVTCGWTPILTNQFDSNGRFSTSIGIDGTNRTAIYRLVMR